MRSFTCLLLLLAGIFHSCSRPGSTNYNTIGDVNAVDSEIFIRNWEITQPVLMDSSSEQDADASFKDTVSRDQGDNMKSYAEFAAAYDEPAEDTNHSAYTPFVRLPYRLNGSYFFVNNYYRIPERPSFLYPVIPALVYAATVIRSDREQDVVFISGANNGLRMWLNGRQILRRFTTGYVQGYQYLNKVHLVKGDNFLLAKLNHVTGEWKFFLKICSIRYANENWLGENYSSICEHYLIKRGDSLRLRLFVPQISAEKPVQLRVTDLDGGEVLNRQLPPARDWTVDVKDLKEGPYAVSLTTDENTFRQYIFYGDHEKYFRSFRNAVEHLSSRNATGPLSSPTAAENLPPGSRTPQNQPSDSQTADSRPPDSRTSDSQTGDSRSPDNRRPDSRSPGSRLADRYPPDNRLPDNPNFGNRTSDSQTADSRRPGSRLADSRTLGNRTTNSRSLHSRPPGSRSPGSRTSNSQTADNRLPDNRPPDSRFRENIDLLVFRMGYIDTVKVEHDNAYERKVTRVLYEMSDMYRHFKKGDEPLSDVPGLHLRGQGSPFYSSETYMIYIPASYRRTSPIPLVMMLPHETGIREFTISSYVSDINRIEYVMHLADKHGFAVVWSSYRIYSNHNLTRMFPDLVAKTLASVKKDYAIDDDRVYAYGDCAGGELSLFMANKCPSFFAAVGVEGPAIPQDARPEGRKAVGMEQANYDFYNTVENYRNFPTCIIHSINDEKTSFARSAKLCEDVSRLGGIARLDTLYVRKGTDLFFSDLMPDNRILNQLFAFYSGKFRRIPDTVWLSTYQLKYNRAFWVTIDDLVPGRKAAMTAIVNRNENSIRIQSSNVTGFTLDIGDLRLDPAKRMEVVVNNKPYYSGFFKGGKRAGDSARRLTIDLHQSGAAGPAGGIESADAQVRKTAVTEGPINDFFSSPFLVVRGSGGTASDRLKWQKAVDTLRKSWRTDFLRDTMPCKTDREISQSDAANYNLILIGADSSNPVLRRIWRPIPLRVNSDSVRIGTKLYEGKDLSYILIYPNPLSVGKYVLVIGSNSGRISSNVLADLSFSGWHDYAVYDHDADVDAGDFNTYWQ